MQRILLSTGNIIVSLILGAMALAFVGIQYPEMLDQIITVATSAKSYIVAITPDRAGDFRLFRFDKAAVGRAAVECHPAPRVFRITHGQLSVRYRQVRSFFELLDDYRLKRLTAAQAQSHQRVFVLARNAVRIGKLLLIQREG